MAKGPRPAPVKSRVDFDIRYRGITEPWRKYFSVLDWDVERKANKVTGGDRLGHIAVFSADGDLVDSGVTLAKYRSVSYSTVIINLTLAELGKVIKIDSPHDVTVYLPSVGSDDVDSWIIIMRLGAGGVWINAADNDRIERSSAGGRIRCREAGRRAANVKLFLATETLWAILGGTGIWDVF